MKHDITGSMLLLRSSQLRRSGPASYWLRVSEQPSPFPPPPPGEQEPLSREGLINLLEEAIAIAEDVNFALSCDNNRSRATSSSRTEQHDRTRPGRHDYHHPPQRFLDGSTHRGAAP